MKKSTKKALMGALIFTITLVLGFGITALSFNLFDIMSANEMKLVFALDVVLLLIIGTIAWFIYENKNSKNAKKKELEKRHNERLNKIDKQNRETLRVLESKNFAA